LTQKTILIATTERRRTLFKKIARSAFVAGLIATLAAWYIRFMLWTSRIDVEGQDIPERFWAADKPFIVAFWHGQMLIIIDCWRCEKPISMLISQNIDGEMIARTLAKLDIGAVRGSSDKAGKDKGGRAALRGMLKMLKNGDSIGITPDGPRGPGMQSKEGLIVLARLSGVPILPVAGASNRARIMGSWDRFNLHLPFARGLIKWGEPIHVPRDADDQTMDAIRLQLDDTLNTLSAETRHKIGVPPLEALS